MKPGNPASVLIVEDDKVYARRFVARHFENDWQVQLAHDVSQSLAAIEQIVDLRMAIVDLRLPGGSQGINGANGAGFEVIERLQRTFPQARIMVHSGYLTSDVINRSHKLKVELVAKGDCSANFRLVAADLLQAEASRSNPPAITRASAVARKSGLTGKQTEVLLLHVSGFTRQEIQKELGISVSTLKTHIREIVRKTGSRQLGDLIRKIYRTTS